MKKTFTWARLLRTTAAWILVFSMLLCGCASTPNDNGTTEGKDNVPVTNGKLEAQDAADGISALYGLLLKFLGGDMEMDASMDMAMQSDVAITLGSEIKEQLGQSLKEVGINEGLSWFESLGLSTTMIKDGDLTRLVVGINLFKKDIISADVIMDMANKMMYATLPGINDQTVGMPMDMEQQDGNELPDMDEDWDDTMDETPAAGAVGGVSSLLTGGNLAAIFAEHKDLIQALPTEEQMNQLILSYLDVTLEYLEEGTTAKETLTQDDVSQSVDATTYVITRYDVMDAAIAVLTKAKTDTELEKALDAFSALSNAIATQQGEDVEQTDLHAELMDDIDDMLKDLQEDKTNSEDDEVLRICVYTANDKTVGIQMTMHEMDGFAEPEDETVAQSMSAEEADQVKRITVYSLEDGNKSAFYLNVMDNVEFSGSNHVSVEQLMGNKLVSGNYTLKLDGVEYLLVELENFTADPFNSETLEGTVYLRLGKGLKDTMETPSPFFNQNTVVKLEVKIDDKGSELNVVLYSGDMILFRIDTATKLLEPTEITVPKDYIDGTNEEAMAQWMQNMDLEALLNNLKEADVPEELIQMLELMMQGGSEEGPPEEEYE